MPRPTFRFLAVAAVVACTPTFVQGQSVDWGDSVQYDSGLRPSVAVAAAPVGTFAVEVHQAGSGVGPLWYRVGQLSGSAIQWGASFQYEDMGEYPSVSISYDSFNPALRVVEVHQAADGVGPLWYRTGEVNTGDNTIQWQDSHQYDNGENPHVALSNGVGAVEVHQAGDGAGPLWYRVGGITGSTISWGSSYQYDNGENPSVSQWNGDVVEVHQAGDGVGAQWYRVGQVSGFIVQWGDSYQYEDNGENPSVALSYVSPDEPVVEVHQADDGPGALWYRAGQVSGSTVQWADSYEYEDTGEHPSLSVLGTQVVEVHEAGDGSLSYRLGVLQP